MANLQFHKAAALPGTLVADAFYFVPSTGPNGGLFAEAYLTDSAGAARLIGNTSMIQELINASLASINELQKVADIPARDALTLTMNSLVLVSNASADATVNAGAALYFYDSVADTFEKVSEFESLDVTTDWADIANGPGSTVAAIDQAVADSHTHANKPVLDAITNAGSGAIITAAERTAITHTNRAQLDKITEDGDGCLLYDGNFPQAWSTLDW